MTSGDALESTAVDNPVFLLVNQTFPDQAPSRYTVQDVRIFIILDQSIKVVSFIFMIVCLTTCMHIAHLLSIYLYNHPSLSHPGPRDHFFEFDSLEFVEKS